MKDLKPDENVAAPEMDTVTHGEAITGSTAYLIAEAAGQISRLCNKYLTMRAKLEKVRDEARAEWSRWPNTEPYMPAAERETHQLYDDILTRILEDADDKEE